jgi:hypothetical protein
MIDLQKLREFYDSLTTDDMQHVKIKSSEQMVAELLLDRIEKLEKKVANLELNTLRLHQY